MTAQTMWDFYRAYAKISAGYTAWSFGDQADALAALVLAGEKTATASAFPLYEAEGEPLPREGDYSVILDSRGQARCVICNTRVTVLPFRQVPQCHAWKEGEGDRSLAYWRQVHEDLFRQWLQEAGLSFDWDTPVVLEEFRRVYP